MYKEEYKKVIRCTVPGVAAAKAAIVAALARWPKEVYGTEWDIDLVTPDPSADIVVEVTVLGRSWAEIDDPCNCALLN